MMTFKQVVDELTPIYKSKAKSTFHEFEITTRLHLGPFFNEMGIGSIGNVWRHYVAKQREINPNRQLRNDKKICRAILGFAYEQRYIASIPFLKLDAQDRQRKRKVTIVTEEIFKAARVRASEPWDLHLEIKFNDPLDGNWDRPGRMILG